jgi:hypothetical protein
MEGRRPDSLARRVKACDDSLSPGWAPWSEWMMPPANGFRFEMAIPNAFVTSAEVGEESIDQPTTRRECVSRTTAQ